MVLADCPVAAFRCPEDTDKNDSVKGSAARVLVIHRVAKSLNEIRMGKESEDVREDPTFLKVVDYFLKTPKPDEPEKPKPKKKTGKRQQKSSKP